jgi:hypothetical protein
VKLLPAILLIGGGVYVLSKVSSASAASSLNFIVTGYSFNTNGLYPTISVNVTAQNVSSQPVQFNALAANAFLNGQYIGNVSGFIPVTIPAAGQAVIPLSILVNVTNVINDVVSIFSGSAGSSAILEMKGSTNLSGLVIPFDLTYQPF